jgi:hypothetical protein
MALSVSRALIALKHFNLNILKRISENTYAFVENNSKDINTGKPAAEVKKQSRADLQSIKDSIEDAFQKKCKINAINNATNVVVAGRTMTITEALIFRQNSIPHLKQLLSELISQNSRATRSYQQEQQKWAKLAEGKDEVDLGALAKTFQPVLYNVDEEIEKLQEVIRFFDEELDSVLTETNPTLLIEV